MSAGTGTSGRLPLRWCCPRRRRWPAIGVAVGAGLGPILEPLVKGVWAELSAGARQRQTDVLFWAIHNGVPVEEMEERINASERTQLLTGFALSAATRTAWEDKLRTLGSSLASGLLAEDDATIDTEQMIIAAITDIEGPQLAMLELLVAWRPGRNIAEPLISGPLDLPEDSHSRTLDGRWISPGGSGRASRSPTPALTLPPRAQPPGDAPAARPGRSEPQHRRERSRSSPRPLRRQVR